MGNPAKDTNLDQSSERLQELENRLQDEKNKYLYLYSEFENFKRRTHREREQLLKFGWESAALELLGVIDNLERALSHISPSANKTLVRGLEMVLRQFKALLDRQGIKRLEVQHQAFDPRFHEAAGQVESEEPEGTVIEEYTPGYTLHDRLLRPARVGVSSGNAVSKEEKES